MNFDPGDKMADRRREELGLGRFVCFIYYFFFAPQLCNNPLWVTCLGQ